jgi:hypothetical protein
MNGKRSKGDKNSKIFLGDIIATYIALSKSRYSSENIRENCLVLNDLHWEFMDEMMKKDIIENWQNHNITKRDGIKSREEFIQVLKQGSLVIDWSEKAVRH